MRRLLLACLVAGSLGAQIIPLSSWVYPALDRLETRGLVALPNVRPYTRADVAAELNRLDARIAAATVRLRPVDRYLVARLADEFGPERGGFPPRPAGVRPHVRQWPALTLAWEPELFGLLRDSVRYQVGAGIEVRANLGARVSVVDKARFLHFHNFDSTDFFGAPWEDKGVCEVEASAVSWEPGAFRLDLGHVPVAWGPAGTRSLILSNNAGSLDLGALTYAVRPLRFSGFCAMLDAKRFLAAHRVDIEGGRFKLGFTEVIVFADSLALAYLNPFDPFFLTQWNRRRDDNILWAGDVSWFIAGTRLYGELLIDDFQFEATPAPNKYGFTLGARATSPWATPETELGLEYTQVRKWTYTQRRMQNAYLQAGRILGSGLGPDADRLTATLTWYPVPALSVHATSVVTRRGIGTVDVPFEQEPDSLRVINPPFPSGTVETTFAPELGLAWEGWGRLVLAVSGGITRQENVAHRAGVRRTAPFFSSSLVLRF